MGTRNLVGVIQDNQWKVAQYGQWDGYPSGQGTTVVKFLRGSKITQFKKQLKKVRFGTEDEIKAIYNQFTDNEWFTSEQSAKFRASKYAYLSRDTSAEILQFIYDYDSDEPLLLQDSHDFLNDGLFCEWAYVIDLDKKVLVVLKGFSKTPPEKSDSLCNSSTGYELSGEDKGTKYYVVPITEFPLNKIPPVKNFQEQVEVILKKLYPEDYDEEEVEAKEEIPVEA